MSEPGERAGAASDPIVISGLGVVAPHGVGHVALGAALRAGAGPPLEVVAAVGSRRHGPRRAALIDPAGLAPLLPPAAARRMSPPSRFAVVAARLAIADAGLDGDALDALGEGTAVFMATGFGASSYSERLLRQVFEDGPGAVSPMLFTESVANAAAAQVALQLGLQGANVTVTQRDAGCLQAVALGAREIASGRAQRALVGGVDEVSPLLHDALARFRALAADPEQGKPFDRQRCGSVMAEGAVVAVLERESVVRSRGGVVAARLCAAGSAFDPTAPPTGFGADHDALARALCRSLARAGRDAGGVSLVVTSASGSRSGDRAVAHWLRSILSATPFTTAPTPVPAAAPTVLAPKANSGDLAPIPFAAAVLACRGQAFGATPGFSLADPELGVVPHRGGPLAGHRHVLVTSLAAGGAASWLLLEAAA